MAPEEWAAMLRQAGAREPWADPAAALRFAAAITFRWPAAGEQSRGRYDRATDAIAELRRVLPDIIADDERFLATLNNPPPEFQRRMIVVGRTQTERELDELRRLLAALPTPRLQSGKLRTPPWQLDAARLYTLYLRHVDPAGGISADGPLCRFVALALVRMGSRGRTESEHLAQAERETIARALRRRVERVRKWLDKSRMA